MSWCTFYVLLLLTAASIGADEKEEYKVPVFYKVVRAEDWAEQAKNSDPGGGSELLCNTHFLRVRFICRHGSQRGLPGHL